MAHNLLTTRHHLTLGPPGPAMEDEMATNRKTVKSAAKKRGKKLATKVLPSTRPLSAGCVFTRQP